MFWIWLLPVIALIALLVWMIFAASRNRVRSGHRVEGEVLHDQQDEERP